MVDDLHMRTSEEHVDRSGENATGMARYKQMQVLDLEKNILQVSLNKCLISCIYTSLTHINTLNDDVDFMIRRKAYELP